MQPNNIQPASALARGRPPLQMSDRRFAPEGIEFCPRRRDHAAGLLALFNAPHFLESASTRGPWSDEGEFNAWLDGIVALRRFEAVALSNGRPVGFSGLYVHSDFRSHCGSVMLGVADDMQGRGIGSTLMALLLATAKTRAGLSKVQLTVFTDNTPAIRLYRSFGFQFEGLHQRFSRRGDGYVDAYSMAVIFRD